MNISKLTQVAPSEDQSHYSLIIDFRLHLHEEPLKTTCNLESTRGHKKGASCKNRTHNSIVIDF